MIYQIFHLEIKNKNKNMSYKVNYYTLAKMNDGKNGNIIQDTNHFFTDLKIEDIPKKLNEYLEPKKQIGVIEKIENVKGICL